MTNSFRLNIELAMPRKRRQVIRLYYSDRRMGAEKKYILWTAADSPLRK